MSVQKRVRVIVAEKLAMAEPDLAGDLNLRTLDWDSLDLLELMVDLEEEFGITVNDERFSGCNTLDELVELVSAALPK